MDPRFDEVFSDRFTNPENETFKVVFYPDRIYHAQYLNATRSPRYRYNVHEVRNQLDIAVLKGQVYMDGVYLCNFLRIEYRASRLTELARERNRFLRDQVLAWVHLLPEDPSLEAQATVKLIYDKWVDAYQVEIWETLEPPLGKHHDYTVLDMMGQNGSIIKVSEFSPALRDVKAIRRVELAFRENDRDLPFGYAIQNPEWDNNFLRTHQEPRSDMPSSPENTVEDRCYLIDFQRGWYFHAKDVKPVRYLNAMMEPGNPDAKPDNVIEMRWLVQRELGSSMVFFHEVTIPPGKVEGIHRHIGTEELYFVTQGKGTAYMAEGDDPSTDSLPTVERDVYMQGKLKCKALPVEPGTVIYTKSGGVHGIRNDGNEPLKFAAFLYHTV
ncbi:MAG TPA: cupin domain-containing protein [Bryobacteraceae bacterium]|nr:cupin domain-containing protein [Bryobacteraceae bacterium]HPQ13874.1 cupin domain-containing protein [Bryobacteraceae bacterium]HPU71429.1 cupin domain-containing protein [Bryobacteraceae bacterium]